MNSSTYQVVQRLRDKLPSLGYRTLRLLGLWHLTSWLPLSQRLSILHYPTVVNGLHPYKTMINLQPFRHMYPTHFSSSQPTCSEIPHVCVHFPPHQHRNLMTLRDGINPPSQRKRENESWWQVGPWFSVLANHLTSLLHWWGLQLESMYSVGVRVPDRNVVSRVIEPTTGPRKLNLGNQCSSKCTFGSSALGCSCRGPLWANTPLLTQDTAHLGEQTAMPARPSYISLSFL